MKAAGDAVTVRFFMPPPALARYVTTFYLTEVLGPPGTLVADRLHPEWANLRFAAGPDWRAAIGDAPLVPAPAMIATGPTSRTGQFEMGPMRSWGIGLQPLGWARFVAGPADRFADRFTDGAAEPAFACFAGLPAAVLGAGAETPAPDAAAEAARIEEYMLGLLAACPPADDEARILAAHHALLDPQTGSVTQLAAGLGMSARSLERLSLRSFGFSPKLLLRRQRFLRSLAQFMLDPSLTWISTIDWHYVDQAHFVRDFRRFMGMSPSAYAALDHPVLRAAARARTAAAGAAVQVLHQPGDG